MRRYRLLRYFSAPLALIVLAVGCSGNPTRVSATQTTEPAATATSTIVPDERTAVNEGGPAIIEGQVDQTSQASTAPAEGSAPRGVSQPTSTANVATTPLPTETARPSPAPEPTAMASRSPTPVTLTATPPGLPSAPASSALPATAVHSPDAALQQTFSQDPNPLQIDVMRAQAYPGSNITIEQTLAPGANYSQHIVSYQSDGYKIYALMTIPNGQKPPTGWPVIVFNHGYIPPSLYRTAERYVAYVDAIARAGYIVFKSDYRGHGSSEGPTTGGGYGSPGYTDDVLNAVASLKAYPDADPQRIGMWGHSMGGSITLRAMVVSKDIKAGVIWGGVVAPYPIMMTRWTRRAPPEYIPQNQRRWRQDLIAKYGTPEENPAFWASISPNTYVGDISGPIQLHHSTTDEEVPQLFSDTLDQELTAAGKTVDYYTYAGDNHNISANFGIAMQRSIAWFDKYVKGASGS